MFIIWLSFVTLSLFLAPAVLAGCGPGSYCSGTLRVDKYSCYYSPTDDVCKTYNNGSYAFCTDLTSCSTGDVCSSDDDSRCVSNGYHTCAYSSCTASGCCVLGAPTNTPPPGATPTSGPGPTSPPPEPTSPPPPTLEVTLVTIPDLTVKVDQAVDLVANVSGTATGNIKYKFDCTNDGTYDHSSGFVTDNPYTWVDGCTYSSVGTYTANAFVNRGGLTATDTVTIVVKTLTVTLSASPAAGTAPLNDVDLTASVGGTATGDVRYRFDCTNDGTYDHDLTRSTPPRTPYTWVDGCDYASIGTYTAKVRVNRGDVATTTTTEITVNALTTPTPTPTPLPTPAVSAWWQVRGGGGAIAAGGGMQSLVPATEYACLVQAPVTACGVAAGNPTINGFGSGQWASTGSDYYIAGAAVDAGALAGKYKYDGLKARIRAGVNPAVIGSPVSLGDPPVGWTNAAGAYWAWVQGPATINGATVANSKLILVVDGTVNVTGNITVSNRNTGNVVIISGGNMTLGGTVGNIDGIYMTDGVFDTGSSPGNPLMVNGTVVAWNGLALARNSSDNSTIPAEVFNFVPDFVVNLPQPVLRRHIVQELENP